MLCVVSPVLQRLFVAALDVSVTDPPSQKDNGPEAVMVGLVALQVFVTVTDVELILIV